MCQLSSMHRVVVCWCWSSTIDLLRSRAWPVSSTCSARADTWMSPFLMARRCSRNASGIFLSVQCTLLGTHHTTWNTRLLPVLPSGFGCTSICRRVLMGQNTTLTSRGFRTPLIASSSPPSSGPPSTSLATQANTSVLERNGNVIQVFQETDFTY